MSEPGADDVDAEARLDAELAILETQLADEPPRPPVAVRTAVKGWIILVVDAGVAREAKDVVVVLEMRGEAGEPLVLVGVDGRPWREVPEDHRGAHPTTPRISTSRRRASSALAVSPSSPPRY